MDSTLPITFVVAMNDRDVLGKNLLASPCLQGAHPHQLIIQEGFCSAATAYNDALSRATNEIIVLVHQDVFLPTSWLAQVNTALESLAEEDPEWGVLGCWGVNHAGEGLGHVYTPGQGVIGKSLRDPVRVQTLDELVLIVRKSSGLRFDTNLPSFHLYGTDICMAATSRGMTCYAISAFCVHNAQQYFELPAEFSRCYSHIKRSWRDFLPIYTSCVTISRFNRDFYATRIRTAWDRIVTLRQRRGSRAPDPRLILRELGDYCAPSNPIRD
jgi:hypothetical protein